MSNDQTASEYAGRLYALHNRQKHRNDFVWQKVDSARHDIGTFLDLNEGFKDMPLLEQAKAQLDTLIGFILEDGK